MKPTSQKSHTRIIAHLDMDAFFASVEERDKEYLKGCPIVVGSDPNGGYGRGVVSTANYKAREIGIHSAMPISRAWRLSEEAKKKGFPQTIFIEPSFRKYSAVSEKIMATIKKYSSAVETASIDEAYFDLSFTKSWEKAEKICRQIKNEIKKKENLTCSIGIGPNKMIAKISAGMKKPDGLNLIRESEVTAFMQKIPMKSIPGIGPKTELLLNRYKIRTISDLQKFSKEKLTEILGIWGERLYDKARGIDNSPLEEKWEAKSIGEQETFLEDTIESQKVFEKISLMTDRILKKLNEQIPMQDRDPDRGVGTFKTLVITIRFEDFETHTTSHTLKNPSSSENTLETEALKLILPYFDKRKNKYNKKIRMVGLRIEKLSNKPEKSSTSTNSQPRLFKI